MNPRRIAPYGARLTLLASVTLAWLFGGCGESVTVGDIRDPGPPSFTSGDAAMTEPDSSLTEYCIATTCPAPFATCPSSQFPCDVNLLTDNRNCGSCELKCPAKLGQAAFACQEGKCVLSACMDGYADCNALVDDDCEVKLGTNDNCSACGDKCPDPARPCIYDYELRTGKCGCSPDLALCGTRCVDVSSSDINCGACGVRCDPAGDGAPARAHAYYGCESGQCRHVKCEQDFADCDLDIENGCETFTLEEANCGRCGKVCEADQICRRPPGGPVECQCPKGETACDHNCVDIGTDPKNCGACGRACTMIAPNLNGSAMCDYGTCRYDCVVGYGDCNSNLSDGCEVNLSSDPYNCGACGRACEFGQPCVGGQCAVEPCRGREGGENAR